MPVFNGERFLAEAIDSVLNQGMEEFELVIVDDGSQDRSGIIIDEFAARDPRIKVLRGDGHRGISAALNDGWGASRAEYVARLDADDIALPDRLQRQADFLDANPRVAVVGGAVILIDASGRPGSIVEYPIESAVIGALLPRRNCFAHPATMIRRHALEVVGGYRFDHVEDYDLWLRLVERFELANLADPVIWYRQHAMQTSFRVLEEQARRTLTVRKAAQARRASGNDPLDGILELNPEAAHRVGVDPREVAKAVEHEWYAWAAILVETEDTREAERAVSLAVDALGARALRGVRAARKLRRAELALRRGRPVTAAAYVVAALFQSPAYASSRLAVRAPGQLARARKRR